MRGMTVILLTDCLHCNSTVMPITDIDVSWVAYPTGVNSNVYCDIRYSDDVTLDYRAVVE